MVFYWIKMQQKAEKNVNLKAKHWNTILEI